MFDNAHKRAAKNIISLYKDIIQPKNGHAHVLMVESFNQIGEGRILEIDEKYSNQINSMLDYMQDQGYEILDVKFQTQPYKATLGGSDLRYQTLICYC